MKTKLLLILLCLICRTVWGEDRDNRPWNDSILDKPIFRYPIYREINYLRFGIYDLESRLTELEEKIDYLFKNDVVLEELISIPKVELKKWE